jgi:predicted XRE-type DNA-binding protein
MQKKIVSNIEIEESSGNVFADLELPNPEERLVKADLAIQINKLIEQKKLKPTAAAKLLGLEQSKISALSRGRLSGFSVERLFKLLSILNQDIEIIIKPHHGRKSHSVPHVSVKYATAQIKSRPLSTRKKGR